VDHENAAVDVEFEQQVWNGIKGRAQLGLVGHNLLRARKNRVFEPPFLTAQVKNQFGDVGQQQGNHKRRNVQDLLVAGLPAVTGGQGQYPVAIGYMQALFDRVGEGFAGR